jgi:ketosteroid isomerase-like protein
MDRPTNPMKTRDITTVNESIALKTAFLNLRCWFFGLLLPFAGNIVAQTPSADTAEVQAAVESFHRALIQGERAAALTLLSSDALILEGGESQTRAEYERHHLAEDITFVSATKTERSPITIKREGNVAWATATSKTTRIFHGRKIGNTAAMFSSDRSVHCAFELCPTPMASASIQSFILAAYYSFAGEPSPCLRLQFFENENENEPL